MTCPRCKGRGTIRKDHTLGRSQIGQVAVTMTVGHLNKRCPECAGAGRKDASDDR